MAAATKSKRKKAKAKTYYGVDRKWIRTKSDKAAVRQGYVFDDEAANQVCDFFPDLLVHSKGKFAGQEFELEKWEKEDFLMPLFGWVHRDTGHRRFTIGYVQIAKKNGKSTLCSGIQLYLLLGDNEPGAEIYNAAADRDQAGIVFRESTSMIRASAELAEALNITESKKRIDHYGTDSFIRVISSEAYTAEGINMHGLIFDELHAQKKRDLWDTLRYSGAARNQPLLLSITTAGWDQSTICYEQYKYAKSVLDGSIEDVNFFPLIYEAEKKDDPTDPKTWKKANPNLGVTITERDMRQAANEAMQSPSKMNAFKRYRLNVWTEQENRWITPAAWAACTQMNKNQKPQAWRERMLEELAGCRCFAGLDLGSTSDITALNLYFPDLMVLMPWFWCPESSIHDDKNPNRNQYATWRDQGFLNITQGNVTDYDYVRADINKIGNKYRVEELAIDRLFQGAQLSTQLMDDGFDIIAFGQGFVSMAAPCKSFEERILSGKFEHGNNPILKWMAGNVTVKTDPAGNMKPSKPERNSPHKIDGIVAAIMSLGRAMLQEGDQNVCNVTAID